MSNRPSIHQAMGPLSVGNVVSAGLNLYRNHLKTYSSIAFRASLWLILPTIASLLLALVSGNFNQDSSNFGVSNPLFNIALAILQIYCTAKFLANAALISRLAFSELINQPEVINQVQSILNKKLWKFWLTQLLVGLLLVLVILVLVIVSLLLIVLIGLLQNGVLLSILFLFISLFWLAVILWFYARWFIPEVPLAVENSTGPSKAISRSWELSKGSAWRIVGVVTIALIVSLPIYILAFIPFISFIIAAEPWLNSDPSSIENLSGYNSNLSLSSILLILFNVIALPFWQAIKSVIYYDLRSRREGLGLTLRDSDENF